MRPESAAYLRVGTIRSVGRRLMDGIEPELVDRAAHALEHLPEIQSVERVRLRWVGHRLHGDAIVRAGSMTLADADRVAMDAEAAVKRHLPNLDEMTVRVAPAS